MSRVPADATAFGNRDANFVMNVHGRRDTVAEDKAGIAWAREVYKATLPFATGGATRISSRRRKRTGCGQHSGRTMRGWRK